MYGEFQKQAVNVNCHQPMAIGGGILSTYNEQISQSAVGWHLEAWASHGIKL